MKEYRPWAPTQAFLLPPSPLDWLPEGHLARFVLDLVETLDLSAISGKIQEKDGRGERPYAPGMMVSLLLYGYSVGVFSSRRMARATHEDVAMRVLAGGQHPHFTTINHFRLQHREALASLFIQVLRLCRKAGLVKLGHVSFDGSKVPANASKHKAMSYKRMQEDEKKLQAEVEALLARADQADRDEDEAIGPGQEEEDLPAELQRREARLAKIREAKAALEREAAETRAERLRELAEGQRERAADDTVQAKQRREAATRAAKSDRQADELEQRADKSKDDDNDDDTMPSHRVPAMPDGTPKKNAQRNFTDGDSRIMLKDGAVLQAYNTHIAVDEHAQVIVAVGVSNQAPDTEHLEPMLDRVIANCNEVPAKLTADNGFYSHDNVAACEERGVDAYISVGKKGLDSIAVEPKTPTQATRQRMATKLQTATGKKIYARRKVIAEPPLGQIKHARGFQRFSFRSLPAVRHEWAFVCLTHNLLKLFRATCFGHLRSARAAAA